MWDSGSTLANRFRFCGAVSGSFWVHQELGAQLVHHKSNVDSVDLLRSEESAAFDWSSHISRAVLRCGLIIIIRLTPTPEPAGLDQGRGGAVAGYSDANTAPALIFKCQLVDYESGGAVISPVTELKVSSLKSIQLDRVHTLLLLHAGKHTPQ